MEIHRLNSYTSVDYLCNSSNNVYILLGDTDEFINKRIILLMNNIELYYVYEISVNDEDELYHSFITSNVVCPIKQRINLMLYKEYKKVIGSCVINNEGNIKMYSQPDKLHVYVLCYRCNGDIKTITMIKCHQLLKPEKEIVIDGYQVNDSSFFYTSPNLIKQINMDKSDLFYKNILLRKEINCLIRKQESSNLYCILNKHIVSLSDTDIWKVIISDELFDSSDIEKLVKFDYDRDKFHAFVRAWYSGQLSNCKEENETIKTVYEMIEKRI
ncbi:virion protein [Fowlpox virus]|uniref:27 kDa core protein n=3 Tax=Fowlpox virus TaxID=10261 RepID=D3_FOWPN|nr:Virion protein [Fowlpox virus]P0DTA9.1 RecName: Full=27 kDa core protein [Fowlpox virus strain NVSL]P0DTB0.1 RecName: Full=27 kDa core protein [Fowlpox virus]UNS14265.1 ALPV-101 [Albatrosspox virus]CAE52613.1 virion core protein D3R orthologue [Fowlpox virus isolate HP-438/Munich]AAF44413.1 ORF FPV069 Virion protein [Fowlpox virus]ART91503.1 virion core protein D3R ortholog [Fowlpox virus]AYO89663.1 virion protein [Fowlpox virus]